MLQSMLLLLTALTLPRAAHAQSVGEEQVSAPPPISATYSEPPRPGVFRHVYDARLSTPADTRNPLISAAPAHRGLTSPVSMLGSHWKAGAVAGGILGGAIGGAAGFTIDNIERPGGAYYGQATLVGAAAGVLTGALLGAAVGTLIRR